MADPELSGRTLGEFVLLDKIGQGGFGAVYRAEQPALKRNVVVKVLRKSDNVAEQRFLREAQLASRFDHPFAAHLYAFGVDEGLDLLWIAMELVQGTTLSQWLEQHGPMPLEQFVPFFECIADAVHAAHECGIVHRDLKPSNVMVIERASRLLPKLLDFGIAKTLESNAPADPQSDAAARDLALQDTAAPEKSITARIRPPSPGGSATATSSNRRRRHRITRTGVAFGSRPYMSPEQWHDAQTVGPPSDVYSLGVLAYEVLTGELPFTAEGSQELFRLHCEAPPPPLGDKFPRDLNRVIGCALAKSPDNRYRSPLEMAAEFREAMQAQPREQLRSLAKVWNDRARSPELLLRGGELLRTPTDAIGDLERAFVSASHRLTARISRLRRVLAATAASLAIGAVWYRGHLETRAAQQLTEATLTQSELEQGRAALLHSEPGAAGHLVEAYRRDRSPSTAFMLARALEPRLAEQARFQSTFERMWSAAFSPDGKQLVTTDDKNAQIFDAKTHQRLFLLPHGDVVAHAVYSADGARLFTACGDGAIRIWDTRTGTLIRELRPDKVKPRYWLVALSPDGKTVAGGSMGMAHVWNADTGAVLGELRESALDVPSLAFSADGRWLAVTTGNAAQVLDAHAWAAAPMRIGSGVNSLSWDPSGPHLLTGGAGGDVSIWAIPSGERIHHLREFGEPVGAVAYSPSGRLVVAGSYEGNVQVWDASSARLQSQSNQLRSRLLSIEFDQTSSQVAAASATGSVAVVDAASGMPVTILEGPTAVVKVAHFDPTSQRVLGASWDGTARLWDATAPHRRWSAPPISEQCGFITSLEPDQRFVVVGCDGQPTRVWDTAQDRLLAELPGVTDIPGESRSAYPAVSSVGDRAAVARGNEVEVLDLSATHRATTIRHDAGVSAVAFSASGRDIISGAMDGSVKVTRGNGTLTVLPASPAAIDAVGFLPDGRMVVADARRGLRIYDPSGATLAEFESQERVAFMRTASDGRRLVTASIHAKRVARPELWDVEHYRRVGVLTAPGQGQVYSARFLSSEKIITGCGDGAFRLWDAATGELRQTYRGSSRFLIDATLSPDGAMLVGGGVDGQLRFWELSSGRPLWTMPAHRSHLIGVHVEGASIITRGYSGDIVRWTLPSSGQVIEACDNNKHCGIVTP